MEDKAVELAPLLPASSRQEIERREFTEDYDYVFIFPNHFSRDHHIADPLKRMISLEKCEAI